MTDVTTEAVVAGYLAGVDEAGRAPLAALDTVVRAAHPGFDVAVKYQLLTYAIDADWRHWVCAVNASKRGLCLRFLYGVIMDDELGVLRAGTANLMTWDLTYDAVEGQADGIGAYVRQAVALFPHYRQNAKQINLDARAAALSRRARRPGSAGRHDDSSGSR